MKKAMMIVAMVMIVGSLALTVGFGNGVKGEVNVGMAVIQQQLQDQVQEFIGVEGDGICDNYEAGKGNGAGDGTGECYGDPGGCGMAPETISGEEKGSEPSFGNAVLQSGAFGSTSLQTAALRCGGPRKNGEAFFPGVPTAGRHGCLVPQGHSL